MSYQWCPYCASATEGKSVFCNDECRKGADRANRFIRKHNPLALPKAETTDYNPLGTYYVDENYKVIPMTKRSGRYMPAVPPRPKVDA